MANSPWAFLTPIPWADRFHSDSVIVEIKSVERNDPVFEAQLLTYLKATGKTVGLLINFNSKLLKNGIKRVIL